MSVRARTLAAALAAVATLPAQDPEQVRKALGDARRDLQQARAEAEALLDARIRHDLGLPQQEDLPVFATAAPAATPQLERSEQLLQQEDEATASLLGRYERLKQQVERLQAEAAARAAAPRPDQEWITVPAPGAAVARPGARDVRHPPAAPAARDGEAAAPESVRLVPNLEPIKAQIQGSSDHGRVAHALQRAAQALMDHADELRLQGQEAAADHVDDEARQRLLRAQDELRAATAVEQPALADLFRLGRARELLFRLAERRDGLSLRSEPREYQRREQEVRDPFVAITARDVVVRAGTQQPGPWARAAQAALDHFRWMNLHAGYRPKTDLDAITWPAPK